MAGRGNRGAVPRLALAFCCWASSATILAGEPRLNQIQVIGSHNSYHIAPHPAVLELIAASGRRRAESIDYTHPPLAEQLSNLGIRQVELDVYADPKGGLFATPSARKILGGLGKDPGPDPDVDGQLQKPGLKVLHVPDVDFRSTAPTFVAALLQIRAWSRAHRRHVPILIQVELKDESIAGTPTRPVHFGRDEIDEVDAEILSVFPKTEILTPDRVRGRFSTLPEAIRAQGWPALDQVRGLVLFALDNVGSLRDLYLEGHPALFDRVMFASVARGSRQPPGSRSTTPSKTSTRSSTWSARVSWSAPGPMPIPERPGPMTSPNATRPWRAGPSSSAPTIPSPIDGCRPIACGSPAGKWPGPIPLTAKRSGTKSTSKAASWGQAGARDEA